MNRIEQLFKEKKQNILSIFFTAGHPTLGSAEKIIVELEKSGADLIEIGIPFSDPVADGSVIQQSSNVALNNGMTLNLLFEQLKNIRQKVKIPLILMGYFNPIFKFGVEKFCKTAAEIGIDGTIIPDLPISEYQEKYAEIFEKYNIFNVQLITPQTSPKRMQTIAEVSKGFVYLVSTSSTTGNKQLQEDALRDYSQKFANINTNKLIGFGISSKQSFETACKYANGAIIGSAFVKFICTEEKISQISEFISSIKG